jgi:hypothetical protein
VIKVYGLMLYANKEDLKACFLDKILEEFSKVGM